MYSTQHIKRLSNRTFGLALAIVFAVMFVIGWLSFDVILVWPLIVAMCLGVIALVVPWVLLPLNRLWHALANLLGQVTNYVILGIFYFIFIVPLGLMLRIFKWDPMGIASSVGIESYWTDVQRRTSAETLRDMF